MSGFQLREGCFLGGRLGICFALEQFWVGIFRGEVCLNLREKKLVLKFVDQSWGA